MKYYKYVMFLVVCVFLLITLPNVSLLAQQKNNNYQKNIGNVAVKMNWSDKKYQDVEAVMMRYQKLMTETRQKKFNKIENRQKTIKSLQELQRTELMDIISVKEYREFAVLLKQEQQLFREEQKLSTEDRKALLYDIRSIVRNKVYPYIAKERTALENLLDTKTKNEIVYLKTQIHSLQVSIKEKQRECQYSDVKSKPEVKACRVEVLKIQKQLKPHIEQGDALVAKIQKKAEIERVFNDLKAEKSIWTAELNVKIAYYFKMPVEDSEDFPVKAENYLNLVDPLNFLIIDADNINMAFWEEKAALGRVLELVFREEGANLKYEVLEKGMVVLDVYDSTGNLLKSLKEEKTAGIYQMPFDTQNIKNGILICSLKDQDGAIVKRFVKIQ